MQNEATIETSPVTPADGRRFSVHVEEDNFDTDPSLTGTIVVEVKDGNAWREVARASLAGGPRPRNADGSFKAPPGLRVALMERHEGSDRPIPGLTYRARIDWSRPARGRVVTDGD